MAPIIVMGLMAWIGSASSQFHKSKSISNFEPSKINSLATNGQDLGQPLVHQEDLAAFILQATQAMEHRISHLEPHLHRLGIRQEPGTPAWFMGVSNSGKASTKNVTNVALMAEETTKYVAHAIGIPGDGLADLEVTGDQLDRLCPFKEIAQWCQPKKYRSLSGHCNNVQFPRLGSAGVAYVRYLPPVYADGISLPRGTALFPEGLPSARDVSLKVHTHSDTLHSHLVSTAAVWAQIVSHDLSLTPQMTGYNGERLRCCGVEFSDFHPECFPIRLPEGDPIHGSSRCQEYTRSATAPRKDCTLGPREQLNEATSFLDASNLYGTSSEENEGLREFSGGRLKLMDGLLPPDASVGCRAHGRLKCFKSGDPRVNEHMGLAAMMTLLAREHNRLADALARLNPHWVDEILFQEARRLLIGQLQIITYKEFLPLILGQDTMEAFSLLPKDEGYFEGYDINVDPTVANSVAAAALHFAVSLMPPVVKLFNLDGTRAGEESLTDSFYAPFKLYNRDGLNSITFGLLRSPALNNNQHVNSVFTNRMFYQPGNAGGGLDLVAQLIQRGRDHGLPGYVQWRQFCGLSSAQTFSDLQQEIPEETIAALRAVYRNVSEIDLLPGALSERVTEGGTVGPTLRCLLAKQFAAIRSGDRHWFESEYSGLSLKQLRALRKGSTLARLICDNTDLYAVQPNAFIAPDPFLNSAMNCRDGSIQTLDLGPWKEEKKQLIIPNNVLAETLNKAKVDLTQLHQHEFLLYSQNRLADPQSPQGTAFSFSRPKRQATRIANTSLMLEFASSRLVRSFIQGELNDVETGSLDSLISTLPQVDLGFDSMDSVDEECLESALPCDHTNRYRTFSGWCNNLDNPIYGQSFRRFTRILPPAYNDGVGAPRSRTSQGSELPSPRAISSRVHGDVSDPHTRYSLLLMQFSQITDHDLTFTPVNKGFVGEGILNCRPCDSKTSVHPECFPIPIPDKDPYFPSKDHRGQRLCIPATRSMPGQLTLGPREQMNQLTAYLDLSFMYGSDACAAAGLRLFVGGRLNATLVPGRKALLPETSRNAECRSPNRICFNAGDDRASEQPSLGSLHTVWMREHNRMATELSKINPHWNDEILYSETRRILGGVYQHISFNEWLVRILGMAAVRKYGLDLLRDGYFKGYDQSCDVTIFNEFSAAAFRFGHSLLRPSFLRMAPNFRLLDPPVRLRDHFFNPQILYTTGIIDEIILGLTATPMETLDNYITKEVTEHLFENRTIPFSGMDLVSLNIQRARDHGLHPYNDYREICGLKRARTFKDLEDTTKPELIQALAQVYAHVDDVDLFPGGMTESALPGGVVGPTFGCIISMQFSKIRKCDRFWYENDREFTRFTLHQLAEIRKSTLASLLCNNLDSVSTIQRAVFDLPDPFMNPRVPCSSIPQMDLEPWRESPACSVKGVSIDVGRTSNTSPCVTCTCTKEGAICQSVKVKNCVSLLHKFGADEVAKDTSCKVQCLYVFNILKENIRSV
ncbi:Animal haem peroxidase [Nesidiocoris tenuis]|uniref:Animal haem peroxidase n=1 Tax=Nesidiocoris tenuis TaxID=355587 RepID=A0ABN7BBV3_9HEMI|nr:Animal haem peroxidase [Nesidiocoris tenuis]